MNCYKGCRWYAIGTRYVRRMRGTNRWKQSPLRPLKRSSTLVVRRRFLEQKLKVLLSYGSKSLVIVIHPILHFTAVHPDQENLSEEPTMSVELVASIVNHRFFQTLCSLKKHLNASTPSEHPPVRGKNVKTFRWDHRLQIRNLLLNSVCSSSTINYGGRRRR